MSPIETLSIENLTVRFGEAAVLDRFCLSVPAGSCICIMGPSGCGKATLLRVMMGLLLPDSGLLSGFAERKKSAVFQENRLCENLSVRANLRLSAPRAEDRTLEAALASLGLKGFLRRPVRTLSGGMQRRIALARALLADYELLFLDEPFTGLDGETRRQAEDLLREQSRGKTVFLATHSEETACALADQIIRLA